MDMYTLLYLKRITNKYLLYSTWNSALYVWQPEWEGSLGEEIHVFIWLGPFTVHLKLSQHCLLINCALRQNKKFKKCNVMEILPQVWENIRMSLRETYKWIILHPKNKKKNTKTPFKSRESVKERNALYYGVCKYAVLQGPAFTFFTGCCEWGNRPSLKGLIESQQNIL